jgi:hypothetical protein
MEIIGKFGTAEQRELWLLDLLMGDTRSCFGELGFELVIIFCVKKGIGIGIGLGLGFARLNRENCSYWTA